MPWRICCYYFLPNTVSKKDEKQINMIADNLNVRLNVLIMLCFLQMYIFRMEWYFISFQKVTKPLSFHFTVLSGQLWEVLDQCGREMSVGLNMLILFMMKQAMSLALEWYELQCSQVAANLLLLNLK